MYSVEIATGTDPDDSAVDVERVPGTQAEERTTAGGTGSRTTVGTRVSGLHVAGGHLPATTSTSFVLPREDHGQFFCQRFVY